MRKRLPLFLFLSIVVVAGWLFWRSQSSTPEPLIPTDDSAYRTTSLRLGDTIFDLEVADTAAKKQLGLGKRPVLAANQGMVFLYSKPGKLCFWMKGMRFAIDILWLDSAKKVISIEKSLSPDTYPQTYCPDEPAQYVVELPAGVSERVGVKVGDFLPLEL